MTIYLILIAFILGMSPIQYRMKRLYLTVCLLFVWIIIAFRSYLIGNDTIAYINAFPVLANLPLSTYGTNPFNILFTQNRFEFGYTLFDKLIYHFTQNPQWLLICSATVIIAAVWYFLYKYSKYPSLALIIFVTSGFMSGSMSQIRQYMAWAISLISIKYILENKLIKFIVTVIIAMLFHISAIVVLPLYWLAKLKVNFKKIAIFSIIILPLFIFFNQISLFLQSFIKSYAVYSTGIANNGTTGYLSITVNLVTLLIFIALSIYLIIKNHTFNKSNAKLINLMLWMLICSVAIQLLSYNFSQFVRLGNYFVTADLILIPNELREYKSYSIRNVLSIILIIYLVLNFVITNVLRPEWSSIIPYSFMNGMW